MSVVNRPAIALDVKLKHYCDPETGDVVGVDQYETPFAYRDRYEIVNRDAGPPPSAVPLDPTPSTSTRGMDRPPSALAEDAPARHLPPKHTPSERTVP